MKQILASMFFDILSYTIGNNILCIFKNFELNLIKIGRLLHIAVKKTVREIVK